MENTNQPQTPLLEEVNLLGESNGVERKAHKRGLHFPYLKLTYPNGVSLTLPADIDTEQ